MRALLAAAFMLGLVTLLSGCSKAEQPWHLYNITGMMPKLEFTLTDQEGQLRHAENFRDRIVLLYFGYTHCPDVCPTTLAKLATVLRGLDEATQKVRILFVSVDPARDTPLLLKRYVQAFQTEMIGLTGTEQQLRALTKGYRMTYGLGQRSSPEGDYEVSHSSAVVVFDTQGAARLLAVQDKTVLDIRADIERLIAE